MSYCVVYAPSKAKEGIAVFARSLKVVIAGIRSLILDGWRPNPALGEDQSVSRVPDLRKLAATDQRTAHDLDSLLVRNGIVS